MAPDTCQLQFKKIPTETPEEKEALDAIEQKSPYDVGAHCSGMGKPVFTQEMDECWGAGDCCVSDCHQKAYRHV